MKTTASTPLGSELCLLPFTAAPPRQPARVLARRRRRDRAAVSGGVAGTFGLGCRHSAGLQPVHRRGLRRGREISSSPDATGAAHVASLAAHDRQGNQRACAPRRQPAVLEGTSTSPMSGPTGCGHAQGLCQSLTAAPSAGERQPRLLHGYLRGHGDRQGGERQRRRPPDALRRQSQERLHRRADLVQGRGAGQVRSADDNPYTLYSKLVGLTTGRHPHRAPVADRADQRAARASTTWCAPSSTRMVSSAGAQQRDKHRLATALRRHSRRRSHDESDGRGLQPSRTGHDAAGRVEERTGLQDGRDDRRRRKLHLELVALAFACNFNRVATLQHGDGTDATKYNVPSNAEPRLAVSSRQSPRAVGLRSRQQPDRRAGARGDRRRCA